MGYISQGASVADIISTAIPAAGQAIQDPAITEVICQVGRLSKISAGTDDGTPCDQVTLTPDQETQGLELYKALPALRAFVWLRANPITATVIVTTAITLFWGWGYYAGHKRGSRKALGTQK